MLELIFWLCAALVVYVYVGYPLLLKLVHLLAGRTPAHEPTREPTLTLVISAFNEEASIREKLDNTLQLDYPSERLQVLVVSDASDDRTDDIVREYEGRGVGLVRMTERGGKTVGLNAALREASGEVVVFSDANAMYRRDALRRLAAPFADPAVGAVVGESTYHDSETASEASESLYWKYETAIKRLESETGSVVGGDGAIYAIRRSLYVPMRADALSDFVNPLQIVKAINVTINNGQNAVEARVRQHLSPALLALLLQLHENLVVMGDAAEGLDGDHFLGLARGPAAAQGILASLEGG